MLVNVIGYKPAHKRKVALIKRLENEGFEAIYTDLEKDNYLKQSDFFLLWLCPVKWRDWEQKYFDLKPSCGYVQIEDFFKRRFPDFNYFDRDIYNNQVDKMIEFIKETIK